MSDPDCQTGLIVFLLATAVMRLAFVLVVVGDSSSLRRVRRRRRELIA